ncbi:hypothetical protein TNCV_3764481 [Trichonephila clavipes]|uniref:Uncharacterized protein n=1 Tax=Trichonephila clavipes TaxID=2585209 RepID=A0A8X7B8J1_TRICX|nr:hypothetical protein TNCV_3764481 [Trichonephila clavipes]
MSMKKKIVWKHWCDLNESEDPHHPKLPTNRQQYGTMKFEKRWSSSAPDGLFKTEAFAHQPLESYSRSDSFPHQCLRYILRTTELRSSGIVGSCSNIPTPIPDRPTSQ